MIPRLLKHELIEQLKEYPVVTVLGPRQAGKTTLVRSCLPDYEYVNLENPEMRALAEEDPKALLNQSTRPVIFDEIQRVPRLISYIQSIVDERSGNGQFVLTGSHQLQLRDNISQSLAGRTGLLHLLPLSIQELHAANIQFDRFEDYLFHGSLPRVYDQNQRPHTAYANYYQTYVERDVRQLIQLKDASLFEKFMRLLAGRVGQIMNHQSMANDAGVDGKTIKHWLSILEASYIVFPLKPYFKNFGKRVIKSPKYYFTDTGLLCYLLGIEQVEQISRDPLVGSLFENLVVLEALKSRYHQALAPNLYFYRDSHGHEIDMMFDGGRSLTGVEIKSASTWHSHFKKNLQHFSHKIEPLAQSFVIYNGNLIAFSDGITALPFTEVANLFKST